MRLAFSPTTVGVSAGDLVSLSVEAERLGYDSAWVAEVAGPEAFSLVAAIAAVTERIDVGIAIVPAATRSPALLAMAASTASSILGGRSFHLGIGSSSELIVREWHGAEFDPPLVRVGEAVKATRALLSGERGYSGQTVQVDRFRLAGSGAGPIGIYIGALGPQMLRLAGAVADGVCLNLGTAEATSRQIEEVRAGASLAGRDLPGSFDVMARFHVVMTEDLGQGRDLIRAGFGPYFAQPVYNRFLAWMGYQEEAAAVAAAFAAGDRAALAAALHDEIIDSMTIVGPAPRIRDRLAEYEESGVDVAALSFLGVDSAGVAAALQALAP